MTFSSLKQAVQAALSQEREPRIQAVEAQAILSDLSSQKNSSALVFNFRQSFDELIRDPYFPTGQGIRRRRLSRFSYQSETNQLQREPAAPFIQAKAYNHLLGGRPRYFEPLSPAIESCFILDLILKRLIQMLPSPHSNWHINVHQIRVCPEETIAYPAPEGIHQDGHDFIAMLMIQRLNIAGGENQVFDMQKRLVLQTTLVNGFDGLLLNDQLTFHGVSGIRKKAAGAAYRDMLIIDFNQKA